MKEIYRHFNGPAGVEKAENPRQKKGGIVDHTVLLLTATINSNNMPGAISPPPRRLSDYARAFSFYVRNFPRINKIVFAENSGWPLDVVREAGLDNPHRKKLEFLSMDENSYPREFGKGFGEHNLICAALEHSGLISKSRYVAKMTGRIFLSNMLTILDKIAPLVDISCDFRDHPFYELLKLPFCGRYCDTRFFVFRPDFFREHLQGLATYHKHGNFGLEASYYRVLKPLEDSGTVRCRFPVEPMFRGLAGHGNKNYSGAKEVAKQTVRGISRLFFPGLRI